MYDEFKMGAVGPEESFEDETPKPAKVPKQTKVSVELTEEVKQEIAFNFALGNRTITNAIDVLRNENKAEYLIEELLPSNGLLFVAGASGTGKTILTFQFASDLIMGRPTLTYRIGPTFREKNIKVLVFSLEMNQEDLQLRFKHMYPNLTQEEEKLFAENYQVYCDPEPFELWDIPQVIEMTQIIKACKPDMVLIDSASVSFAMSMNNEEQVRESIKNIYKIRSRLNVAFMVAAHTRKPPAGILSNPEEATLNELMGVAGFGQAASAILIMVEDEKSRKETIKRGTPEKDEKVVYLVNAKARFGANSGAFKTTLTSKNDVDSGHPLMFKRNAIPIAMTDSQRKSVSRTSKSLAIDLNDAFTGIDFGTELDGDE